MIFEFKFIVLVEVFSSNESTDCEINNIYLHLLRKILDKHFNTILCLSLPIGLIL